jgi:hypothetical protein
MGSSRQLAVTALLIATAFLTVGTGRATARLTGFGPAAAISTTVAPSTVAPAQAEAPSAAEEAAAVVQPTPEPTPEPTAEPAPPEPVNTPAPAVARQPVSTPAPVAPPPAPATCPTTWFCYPRLGIAGPIVPYTDCSGSTDVGTAIRSYSCLSDHYLMGHAYTQFGKVTRWVAGDVVFAWGQRYTVRGAVTQQSCSAPTVALAPLSMQTSLTSNSCGAVLVVQAR